MAGPQIIPIPQDPRLPVVSEAGNGATVVDTGELGALNAPVPSPSGAVPSWEEAFKSTLINGEPPPPPALSPDAGPEPEWYSMQPAVPGDNSIGRLTAGASTPYMDEESLPPLEMPLTPPPPPVFAYPVIEDRDGTRSVTGLVDEQAVRVSQKANGETTIERDLNYDNQFGSNEVVRATPTNLPSTTPGPLSDQQRITQDIRREDQQLDVITARALQQGRVSPEELANLASYGNYVADGAAPSTATPAPTPGAVARESERAPGS